jgi:quercetin dioxygenase-like cupin family protein
MLVARNADIEGRSVETIEGLPVQGEVNLKALAVGARMVALEIRYRAGANSPVHTHSHESLCYVVEGEARFIIGDEAATLKAGDVCRHPEGVPHSIEAIQDTTVLEVKSPPQPLEQFLGTGE